MNPHYDMLKLDENVKIAYLKAFSRLARADGNIDKTEQQYIKNMARAFQISKDKINDVLNCNDDEEIIKEIAKIKDRRIALYVIKELCFLAHADKEITDDEIVYIGKIGQVMGVELEKIEQISNWVIDKIILAEEAKIIFEEVKK